MRKTYHFSCGNTMDGPLGLCAEIMAESEEDALSRLRSVLADSLGSCGELTVRNGDSLGYVNIYVNPSYVRKRDIDGCI